MQRATFSVRNNIEINFSFHNFLTKHVWKFETILFSYLNIIFIFDIILIL